MPHRRTVLRGAVAAAVSGPLAASDDRKPARNGRVKQSVVFWCFNGRGDKWSPERCCEVAAALGCGSVEFIGPEHWGLLKRHNLICAIAGNGMPGAPFMRGFNNPKHRAELVGHTKRSLDQCGDAGFPNVIAFVGYKWRTPDDPKSGTIPDGEAFDECVKGLKEVVGHAEKRGVTLCLEHLNTRDDTDPMKGHPGYQGDDLDFCARIVRKVGSPRLKLLFDVYHVQVMHGDILRRIEQNKDIIGHVHTAGCPGRGELDETQEVNYPAVMKKLLAVGYAGWVGQEFIPTRDPLAGLTQAVALCDV
jgi:hydroxypyruvate isomerase